MRAESAGNHAPRPLTALESNPHTTPLSGYRDPRLISGLASVILFFLGWNLIPQHKLPEYPLGDLLPYLIVAVVALGMLAITWLSAGKAHLYARLTHLFSLGVGLSVVAVWGKLEFGPNGVLGDSWFSATMIAKFKHFAGNTDFVYQELHSFYPPLYHWLLGKLAWLTGAEPWTMLNVGMTLTAFFLPWGVFAMWKRIVPERLAFVFVVLTILVARDDLLFKPFEAISITLFIPWLLRFVEFGRGQLSRRTLLWGGLIGAGLFMTYYYYFFLLLPYLLLRAGMERREAGSWEPVKKSFRSHLRLLGWTALFSAPFWLPLAWDFLRFGVQSFQNRWFQPYMIAGPYGDGGIQSAPIIVGLLLLVGLAYREKLARAFLWLLIAQLGWLLLGYIGMLIDTPLLHMRIFALTEYLAWFSLGWGALLASDQIKVEDSPRFRPYLPVAMAILISFSLARGFHHDKAKDIYKIAARSEMPGLVWFPEFRQRAAGKVFLTNRYDICAYRPLYYFIAHNAHFSHPAGRFRQRLKFLCLISQSRNSAFLANLMRKNRYGGVDYLILDEGRMKIYDDNFPNRAAHKEIVLQFDPAALRGPGFVPDPDFPEMIRVEGNAPTLRRSRAERAVENFFAPEGDPRPGDANSEAQGYLQKQMEKPVDDYLKWARTTWQYLDHDSFPAP